MPLTLTPITAASAATYLSAAAADALAATIKALAAWPTASSGDKQLWLQQATAEIDNAMVYQGRRFDLTTPQVLQFPRMLREVPMLGSVSLDGQWPYFGAAVQSGGFNIADWDPVNLVAVVPPAVSLATLYQADAIGSGATVGGPADAAHSGLKSQGNTGMQESYDLNAPGAQTGLCRAAWMLVRKYRLTSGRIL
jgi:hypothetical protein